MHPEVYERAAEILSERGLHKGAYLDESTGSMCIYGALNYALGNTEVFRVLHAPELNSVVSERHSSALGLGTISVNDSPETTVEDMVMLLKLAAERARENNHHEEQ